MTRNYGQLPSKVEWDALWRRSDDEGELRGGLYRIRLGLHDSEILGPHFGDGAYNRDELWTEIERATSGNTSDEVLDFVSCILQTMGVEWV